MEFKEFAKEMGFYNENHYWIDDSDPYRIEIHSIPWTSRFTGKEIQDPFDYTFFRGEVITTCECYEEGHYKGSKVTSKHGIFHFPMLGVRRKDTPDSKPWMITPENFLKWRKKIQEKVIKNGKVSKLE